MLINKKQQGGITYRRNVYDKNNSSYMLPKGAKSQISEELEGFGGNNYFNSRIITNYQGLPADTTYLDLNMNFDPAYQQRAKRSFNNTIRKNIVNPPSEFSEPGGSPERFQKYYNEQMNYLNQSRVNLRKQREAQVPAKQQGGNLDDTQKQFVAYLIQISGSASEDELNQYIQDLGETGLEQEFQNFKQLMTQGAEQEAIRAKQGAKLNYLRTLRGKCPDGYEMGYFEQGGIICSKCMKKQQGGTMADKKKSGGTKVIADFKTDMSKGKMTTKVKKDQKGGKAETKKATSLKYDDSKSDSVAYQKMSLADKTKYDLKKDSVDLAKDKQKRATTTKKTPKKQLGGTLVPKNSIPTKKVYIKK